MTLAEKEERPRFLIRDRDRKFTAGFDEGLPLGGDQGNPGAGGGAPREGARGAVGRQRPARVSRPGS
jgi:hypothetical protein